MRHTNFGPIKKLHLMLAINLKLRHNSDQSFEMLYFGVRLYKKAMIVSCFDELGYVIRSYTESFGNLYLFVSRVLVFLHGKRKPSIT